MTKQTFATTAFTKVNAERRVQLLNLFVPLNRKFREALMMEATKLSNYSLRSVHENNATRDAV